MDKTIYVINCHGTSDLSKQFYIPENTYIITLNNVGTRLIEQGTFFWELSDKISRDPPLFLYNYETKKLSREGEELQDFLSTHEMFENEDEKLTLRNHLPGDKMTDIILTFNEPNKSIQKFFNVSSKTPDDRDPIRDFFNLKDVYLSDYIKTNGPGVYVLLVCRSLPNYKYFSNLYKRNDDFRRDVDMYLHVSRDGRGQLKKIFMEEYPNIHLPILDEMIKHQINRDQIIDFLLEPPQLTLARKHSNVTDKSENTVSQRIRVHNYYIDELRDIHSQIDHLKKEIETFIDPKKKDLPQDNVLFNGKIIVTPETNTKGLMDVVTQLEIKFSKSLDASVVIELFLSVFDPVDEPFLHEKIVELKMAIDKYNELLIKKKSLPSHSLTRKLLHDSMEARTVPDSLDTLDGGKLKRKHKLKHKSIKNKKNINNFLKSARYNR